MSFSRSMLRIGVVVLGLALTTGASEASTASIETWVEATFTDCEPTTPVSIHAEGWNWNATNTDGLDADGREGTSGEAADTPNDSIFGSIRTAVSNTNAGGTVHIPARGAYRDQTTVTISDSVTLHGYGDADVILAGDDCFASSGTSASTALTISIAAGETVVLENLDIRRYTKAIDLTGSTGGTLVIRNCRFHDNTTHIEDDGGGPEIQIYDSFFFGGDYGVRDPKTMTVARTTFAEQAEIAIDGEVAVGWRFVDSIITKSGNAAISAQAAQTGTHVIELFNTQVVDSGGSGIDVDGAKVTLTVNRSVISGNGADGIHLEAQTDSIYSITDSVLEANTTDGIFIENTKGCTLPTNLVSGAVSGSRITANGDDGIEIGGTGSGCSLPNFTAAVECGLLANTIVGNGDVGIVETTSTSSFHCGVGANMISYNVNGAESGTGGVCTNFGTSQNQVN